jgi:hypothetical protein
MCLLLAVLLPACQSARHREIDFLRKVWTPEVRAAFIEMGAQSGCFVLKEITTENGTKIGCYASSSFFDKAKREWVTECEPLCKQEAPECYADGWNPPLTNRCRKVEEWDRDRVR